MAIRIIPSNKLTILPTITISNSSKPVGQKTVTPQIFISTNPSNINIHSLTTLYCSCSHSPDHRLSACTRPDDIDSRKLGIAVANSSVVVSVFAREDVGDGADGEEGGQWWGRMLPAALTKVTQENGKLVGFGRAVSDLGLTASIYDVMVIPPLRRMGIGRMIVQRILRMLANRGIYDISALCSEKERLFFGACGFGDDILGSTTMMYIETASSGSDCRELSTLGGRRPPILNTS